VSLEKSGGLKTSSGCHHLTNTLCGGLATVGRQLPVLLHPIASHWFSKRPVVMDAKKKKEKKEKKTSDESDSMM
jgi:hypothetical protein